MNNDANLGDRELLDEDIIIVDTVPAVSEDVYNDRAYAPDDGLDDESGIRDETTTGRRSMGGAVGTQHRKG